MTDRKRVLNTGSLFSRDISRAYNGGDNVFEIDEQTIKTFETMTAGLDKAKRLLEENERTIASLTLKHASNELLKTAFEAQHRCKTAYANMLKSANTYCGFFQREVVYSESDCRHYIAGKY